MATNQTPAPSGYKYDANGNLVPVGSGSGATTTTPSATVPQQNSSDPNATVQLSPAALSGAAAPDTNAGNTTVLARAQNDVLTQPQTSDLQNATTRQAMNWVNNPMGDFDPNKTKQAQLEKAHNDWANAYESARQQYGNVSGSGLLQKNMLENALKHNVDQQALESQIDTDNYNKYVDSLGRAIGTAQSVNKSNEDIFSQRLGNLSTVRGMAEGERSQTSGQEFTASEAQKTRDWNTSERLSTEDFTAGQADLDRQLEKAIKEGDWSQQKYLQEQQFAFDLKKQTNEFGHDEKMKYLDAQIAEAKANNDVAREKQILEFKHTQELDTLEKQFGHDEAMKYLDNQLAIALQNNDAANTMALTQMKIKADAVEHDKDLARVDARIALERAGVDMQKAEQTYNFLSGEVEAGRADPSVLTTFTQGLLSQSGITIKPPDPNASAKAATAKYNDMVKQYSLTHPDMVNPDGSLKPEGVKSFNDYFNSATYGEKTPAQKAEEDSAGYLTDADIGSAQDGDKFDLKNGVTGADGKQIPPGKYTVYTNKKTTGDTFWGTKHTDTIYYLKDENGKDYRLKVDKGSNSGNIVSNLWA